MTLFQAVLMLATLLCSLVAGFLLAFAVVVMPGIRNLDDANFIRTFQVIDRVIQDNQPLFVLMWVGSVLAVLVAVALSFWTLTGIDRLLVIVAALVYVLGVQLPTGVVNIPLNNRIQTLDVTTMSDTARQHARAGFEPRWNRWNVIRAACAGAASVLLLLILLKL